MIFFCSFFFNNSCHYAGVRNDNSKSDSSYRLLSANYLSDTTLGTLRM